MPIRTAGDPRQNAPQYAAWDAPTVPLSVPQGPRSVGSPLQAGVRPVVTREYLERASEPGNELDNPQPLLIITDLNGTLLYRKVGSTNIQPRHGLNKFLDYVFKHHTVMVWTSSKPENMHIIVRKIMDRQQVANCAAIWGRNTLGLTGKQYNEHVQVYKNLDTVWKDEEIQRRHPNYVNGWRWDATNTVLLDDSNEKAVAQPYNLINVPELKKDLNVKYESQRGVLALVQAYLERIRLASNVSSAMRLGPFTVVNEQKYQKLLRGEEIEDFPQLQENNGARKEADMPETKRSGPKQRVLPRRAAKKKKTVINLTGDERSGL